MMQHLLLAPRPPIDAFETTVINAFERIAAVEAIWIREVPAIVNGKQARLFTRAIWLQLHRHSRMAEAEIRRLADELALRTMNDPFEIEIHIIVDDLPPAAVCPSCIFRRGSGRV
jgi:hypothetical protein